MKAYITLDNETSLNIAERAPYACFYWQNIAMLPSLGWLLAKLRKPIAVDGHLLRVIGNDDAESVDVLVQLALFGEIRFG